MLRERQEKSFIHSFIPQSLLQACWVARVPREAEKPTQKGGGHRRELAGDLLGQTGCQWSSGWKSGSGHPTTGLTPRPRVALRDTDTEKSQG